jgi:hypothetical protein
MGHPMTKETSWIIARPPGAMQMRLAANRTVFDLPLKLPTAGDQTGERDWKVRTRETSEWPRPQNPREKTRQHLHLRNSDTISQCIGLYAA